MASFLTPAGAQAATYLHLLARASDFYRYREASDALQAAVDFGTTVPDSDKWQVGHGQGRDRFLAWQRRCCILRDRYYKASRSDRAKLRQVAENPSEPHCFRVVAAYTLAVVAWDVGKWDKAAAWHRAGLVWDAQMPSVERDRACTCEGRDLDSCETSTVALVANDLRSSMLQHLRQLEDYQVSEPQDPCNWTRRDGSIIPHTVRLRRPGSFGAAPGELLRRTGVGGSSAMAATVSAVTTFCCAAKGAVGRTTVRGTARNGSGSSGTRSIAVVRTPSLRRTSSPRGHFRIERPTGPGEESHQKPATVGRRETLGRERHLGGHPELAAHRAPGVMERWNFVKGCLLPHALDSLFAVMLLFVGFWERLCKSVLCERLFSNVLPCQANTNS